jgi:predicted MFS family arabinose efflux permease
VLRAALMPDRLGPNFPWIWSSSAVGNLGDGVLLVAGPLLVASITPEPFPVAMAFFAQRLPWFLFGLFAGAVVDRVNRRALVIWVDLFRAAVLAVLAGIIVFDVVGLPAIYAAMFLLGSAETVADNATSALVATAVPTAGLGPANSRLIGTVMVTNQLAGPPLGAFIFGVGIALPFGFNAICFLVAVALVAKVQLDPLPQSPQPLRSMRADVMEGVRWLWNNAPVRTLAIMIAAFNITFGAAFSIWVLYSYERLGLNEFGFGVLMATSAVGGVVGSMIYGRLEERLSYATLLRIGLILETFTHLGFALTRSPLVAGAIMFAFGAHAVVWGTTATTVRQRSVPPSLLGRVTSVYLISVFGSLSLGGLLGGAIGQRWGVTGPFWFAFVGSAIILVLLWRSIAHVAQAVDESELSKAATAEAVHSPPL